MSLSMEQWSLTLPPFLNSPILHNITDSFTSHFLVTFLLMSLGKSSSDLVIMSAQRKNERDAYVFKEVYPKADSRMWQMQHTKSTDRFIMEGISGGRSWKSSRISGNKGNSTKNMCMCGFSWENEWRLFGGVVEVCQFSRVSTPHSLLLFLMLLAMKATALIPLMK